MRILLMMWFFPLVFFWGWYALSVNDISFGLHFFSRDLHDLVFQIYANMLGVEPEVIPGMVAAACAFDSLIVLGIAAIRWRASWYPQFKAVLSAYWNDDTDENDEKIRSSYSSNGQAHPAE